MWSGPRTVSTALMRAWENRPDTVVVDEPLYAFYLTATGLDHPGRDEVIASQPGDWRVVLRDAGPGPLPPRRDGLLPEAHDAPPAAVGGPGRAGGAAARVPDQGSALSCSPPTRGSGPRRPWPTSGCGSRRRSSRSSAGRCSTRPTCSPRPSRRCARCAPRSACRSPPRCCPGRRAARQRRRVGAALVRQRAAVDRASCPSRARCPPPVPRPGTGAAARRSACLTTRNSGKISAERTG